MSCSNRSAVILALLLVASNAQAMDGPASGPLRVSKENPRYFADGNGKVVYLTGSHTWGNLCDTAPSKGPPFDYPAYLDFLKRYHHNFIRLWAPGGLGRAPIPYARTGPGTARDGGLKADLDRFDPAFFDRLRSRVAAAQERGIYVGIMLFGPDAAKREDWNLLLFNPANNVQGIDADTNQDGSGAEAFDLSIPKITACQEAFVRKVVDTVNDLDNVLYEIGNEGDLTSVSWQYHMIRFIKGCQAVKPKQHPVGMTAMIEWVKGTKRTDDRALFDSPADWISPAASPYKDNPPAADGRKVIIADVDHIWPRAPQRGWIWECFLRGMHPIHMDCYYYDGPEVKRPIPGTEEEAMRKAMGYTLVWADRMNLAAMTPRNDLASTGYCLADPGEEYLVYLPDGGEATVDLSVASGPLVVEWFNPQTGAATAGGTTLGGAKGRWRAPFAGAAVLYLRANGIASHEYHVATTGSDASTGTAGAPFRTIQKAADIARRGDTVLVHGGRYPEQVTIASSGVTFRSTGDEGAKVEGAGERRFGFYAPPDMAVSDISIEGFEVAGQTQAAISATGKQHARFRIRNNCIHHALEKGVQLSGAAHLVEGNTVYMIGNAQEAMGVFLTGSSRSTVRGNQIYLCKKEGIRDYGGRENRVEDNIVYLCWTGLAFNSSQGGLIASNNYLYQNVMGFNPKHTQGKHGWNCFWHNTVYESAGWSVGIGINDPPLDYLDIRNNIFSNAGEAHVYETPQTNGSHLILDGNLYHREADRPPLVYLADGRTKAATIEELQERTSYEKHGIQRDPLLVDPARGDLDYPPASPAAQGGLPLESSRGKQLGARGLKQTTPDFVRLPLRAMAASSNEALMARTADNLHHTTWDSGTAIRDQWILYDLGAPRSFRYIVLVPFGHKVEHNVRDFSFDISDERRQFTTILSGTNNDSGSIFIYELASPVTTRYLRFTMKNKFPDDGFTWTRSQLKFADLWVGNLTVQPR